MLEELAEAIYLDEPETVMKIIENGLELDREYPELGFTFFEDYGYGYRPHFYEFLGTKKNYGDCIPLTPLQIASFHGRDTIVKILLSEGATSQLENTILKETARSIAGHAEKHDVVRIFKHYDQDNVLKKNRKIQEKKEKKEKKKERSKENKEKKQQEKEEKKKRIENKKNKKKKVQEDDEEEETDELEIEN